MSQRADARVLIVDDHVEMARVLAEQLAELGYATQIADNGSEALRLTRSEPADVVITDLRMEKVDGFDVLEGVHAVDPSIPVLIMTAFGAIESAVEAIRRGAFHYFTKPVQLSEGSRPRMISRSSPSLRRKPHSSPTPPARRRRPRARR